MDRLGGRGGEQPPHFRGRPVSSKEAATANEYFEPFLNATTMKSILGYHRSMCEYLHLKPNVFTHFYPKLRANLNTWRAKALWKKFDTRAAHKCYGKSKICAGTKVLIIGGGPCGLRTAIEAQLLGAKVVVIEKRDRLSRNNVLHLWPFVIEDLRMLGAKKFFGKFCAGSIDHISIRQLQCVLLKAALLLGVEIHTEVSFERLIEPSATEKTGWRAQIQPADHPVSQYEFDVIIGADGKRNTLQGFKRKEFRGKLAIAITANFINKKSEAEAQVEEISGVAFIFNQKFFKDLHAETRIDLENIVYYKDDTHYFVMTAKKASLLEKGVIKQDLADTEKLLAPDNVDRDALKNYARQAADFSTDYKLPDLEFAVNHYGQPDVAMFDFTSMYAAEYASQVVEKSGHRLLKILVGDSLLEPFWPTGSGCARGFLSALDAAWAIRSWSMGAMTPLDVLAERESIYRLLAQTTPDNLNKDWKSYTLDPATRYPNLNKKIVQPIQTAHQYDTDNQENIEKMKRASSTFETKNEVPKKRRRGNVDSDVLLTWLAEQLRDHEDIHVTDLASLFKDGKVLCAIIHHYRPDLLDYHSAITDNDPAKANQLAIDIFEKDLGISPIVTGEEITNTEDYLAMASYLTQVYDTFRGEIPHIKHPKLEVHKKFTRYSKIPKLSGSSSQEFFKEMSCGDNISLKERKLKKLKPNHLLSQKPIKYLSEKTFLNASINSLVKNPVSRKKSNFIDLTFVEHGILKTFSESDESQKSMNFNRRETQTDKSCIPVSSKKKIKTKRIELLSVIPENSEKPKLLRHRGSQISAFSSNLFKEIEVQCDKVSKSPPPPVPEFKSNIFNCETFIQNVQLSPKTNRVSNLQNYSAPSVEIPPKPEKRYYPKYYKILRSISHIKGSSPSFVKRLVKYPYTASSKQISSRESNKSINELGYKTSNDNNTLESSEGSIRIRLIERGSDNIITYSNVEFKSTLNILKITSKLKMSTDNLSRRVLFDSRVELAQEVTGNLQKKKVYKSRVLPSLNPIQEILIKSTDKINNKPLIPKYDQTKTRIFANNKIEELFRNKVIGKSKRNEGDNIIKSAEENVLKEQPQSAIAPNDHKIICDLEHVKTATGHLSKSCRKFRSCFQNTLNNQIKKQIHQKLPLGKMSSYLDPEEFDLKTFKRVHQWISTTDFGSAEKMTENDKKESKMVQNSQDGLTDITSITQQMNKMKKKEESDDIKIEERTYCIRCEGPSSEDKFIENVKNVPEYKTPLKKLSKFSSNNMKSDPESPTTFYAIIESEENELPEIKRSDLSLKALRTAYVPTVQPVATSRPSSRHKRHADAMTQKVHSIERKRERKRRTLEKVGPSVMLSKFMSGVVEAMVVGFFLIVFDILINPDAYVEEKESLWLIWN